MKKYKWSTAFLLLASIQAICTIALLTPALVHVREIYYSTKKEDLPNNEVFKKAFKISGEYVMFLVFEVWRLWLAIDGVYATEDSIE